MLRLLLFLHLGIYAISFAKDVEGIKETDLNYELNSKELERGNFQYFYSLLKNTTPGNAKGKLIFKNLTHNKTKTPTNEIAKFFFPLDTKNLWNSKEDTYLAVAKFSYLVEIDVTDIDEAKNSSKDYLQKTLPRYEVTKTENGFHVAGSFITPSFELSLKFLNPTNPEIEDIIQVDKTRLKSGEIKICLMHQKNFGRVMLFKTASMASALIIYEKYSDNKTLITQYVMSNILNVPTQSIIRYGMIQNLTDVVNGTKSAIKELY